MESSTWRSPAPSNLYIGRFSRPWNRWSSDDRFEYDGNGYVPHLTLGATFAGATAKQLLELEREAGAFIGGSFGVSAVFEFHRATPTDPYRPLNEFQLTG